MSLLRKTIIYLLCGLSLSFSHWNGVTVVLSPSALREDVSDLRKALEKYHPGLYWYTSKQLFNLTWDSLNAEIDKPMTEDQFFKLLLPVMAKVKCAHMLFYPSDKIISNGLRFPLDLKFIDDKAYIVSDISNQYLVTKGSELLSINGRPIKEILNLILPNLEAQGGNIGWKYVILENDFQNYYYYLIEHAETFQVEFLDHVNYRNDKSVAIITVKSFTKGRYKFYNQDFDELIDQYFKEIREKEVRNLIIDIRGNEGGNQPEKLYSYLAKANKNDTHDQNKYYDIKQAKNNFEGNVIVLTNERSISAQEGFVSIFKYHNRGITIGRSTPGCAKYLCGGKKHKLILPNSKFKINIPMNPSVHTDSINLKYKVGEGYPPDFRVEDDINALLAGKDVVMEFALSKIK